MSKYNKINEKLSWEFVNPKTPYVRCKMVNKEGKKVWVDYNAYIFGLVGMQKFKKMNEEHSVIIIDGFPGSGKSTFIEGIAALDSAFMGEELSINDIAWSMDNMISKMDSTENKNRPIWADEFIQGTGRFNQSNIGMKLKIGFVTKRLKKNTYYLVVDEIKEIPEKLIKMADGYIHVKKIGFSRGYYNCWTNKDKIYNLWDNFKNYKNTWDSPWIKKIKPDNRGKFNNYRGIWLDVEEFDKRKMEETAQNETKANDNKRDTALIKSILHFKSQGLNYSKIAEIVGYSAEQVGRLARTTTKT